MKCWVCLETEYTYVHEESYLSIDATGNHVLFLSSSRMQRRNTQKMLEQTILFMAFGSALYVASNGLASSEAGPLVNEPKTDTLKQIGELSLVFSHLIIHLLREY